MNSEAMTLIGFIKQAEKLKTELRHSYTSDIERKESVAEHSWMLALMAILMFDYVELKVDRLKVMKIVIIHDLAEAITGDIPTFEISERNKDKYPAELAAMKKLTSGLPEKLKKEIIEIWEEYEAKQTDEAKMAQCLDKTEVLIQHTIADMSTWDEGDYRMGFYNKDEFCNCDKFLRQFKDLVNDEMWQKLIKHDTVHNLSPEHQDRYKKEKATRIKSH
jgi:putative hydrolases of HD superfamily